MYPVIYVALPTYGVMAFIGGFFSLVYVYFRIDKFNVKFTDYIKIYAISLAGAFIGGKVLSVITLIPRLFSNFSLYALSHLIAHSGIVFYGGLFGVLLALKIYAKRTQYEESAIYLMVVPAIPLFHGFGRIGCFLAGCCYGKELNGSFVLFNTAVDRIPIQLFEALYEFILFFVILFLEKKHKEWNLLKIYLVSYAIFRFANEFFRGDEVRGIFFGFSTAQWISFAIEAFYTIKEFPNSKAT